jgi:hypothetical protein
MRERCNMGIVLWRSLGTSFNKGLKIAGFAVKKSAADNAHNLMLIPPNVDRPWTAVHESNQLPNNNRKRF